MMLGGGCASGGADGGVVGGVEPVVGAGSVGGAGSAVGGEEGVLGGGVAASASGGTDGGASGVSTDAASVALGGEGGEGGDSGLPERRDGRPAWWFGGERVVDGARAVCVEAVGRGVVEARRAVVSRAREAWAGDGRVVRVSVRRLPNPGGDVRYAGYAMVALAVEGDPRGG